MLRTRKPTPKIGQTLELITIKRHVCREKYPMLSPLTCGRRGPANPPGPAPHENLKLTQGCSDLTTVEGKTSLRTSRLHFS
jgi:hypothetical protein